MIRSLLMQFTDDPGVRLLTTLVALNFILGVLSSLARRTFRLAYLGDFLRADVLGKLFPYFAIWAAVRVGGDVELGGVGAIEESTLALMIAALSGSLLNSIDELRLRAAGATSREEAREDASMPLPMPDVIAGDSDPPTP